MGVHMNWRLAVIVSTFVVYLGTLGVNLYYTFEDNDTMMSMMAGNDWGVDPGDGWEDGATGVPMPGEPATEDGGTWDDMNVLNPDAFGTKILPSSWVFSVIWGGIYAYQFLWQIYALTLLFRMSGPTSYLYYDPPFIPIPTYLTFAATSILGAVWLYVAYLGLLWENLVVIFIMWIFVVAAFFTALSGLNGNARKFLKSIGKAREIAFTIGLVHNALAMYMTWLTVATLESLTISMIFVWGVDSDIACYIALGILALVLIVWFVLDNFVLYQKTKYVFTPYVVFIVAMVGIITRAVGFGLIFDPVNIFVIIHLSLGTIALVIKLIFIITREAGSGEKATMYSRQQRIPKMPKIPKSILKKSKSSSRQMAMDTMDFGAESDYGMSGMDPAMAMGSMRNMPMRMNMGSMRGAGMSSMMNMGSMGRAAGYRTSQEPEQRIQTAQQMVVPAQESQQMMVPAQQPQQMMMPAQPVAQPQVVAQPQQVIYQAQPQQQMMVQQQQPMIIQQPQQPMIIQQPAQPMVIQQPQPLLMQQPQMVVQQPQMMVAQQPMMANSGAILFEQDSSGGLSPLPQVVRQQVTMPAAGSQYDYIYV